MKVLALLFFLLFSHSLWARPYVIFSLTQDLPMGYEGEIIRKNYYINMGSAQGVRKDILLDVFRIVSIQNPYENKKRTNYKVKIGRLKVLHSSEDSSIAIIEDYEKDSSTPIFELSHFMIGDHVAIHVD